jgi:hypothetical protein
MGRARDIANILSSSGNVALDSELGLSLITPSSIAVTGGSGSISSSGAVSFTSASAVSFNNVFSATYDSYLIQGKLVCSTDAPLYFRARLSGTDNSSANYKRACWYYTFQNPSVWNNYESSADLAPSLPIGGVGSVNNFIQLEVSSPFLTDETVTRGQTSGNNHFFSHGVMSVTTSYDGCTIFPNSGTITGTLSVYGYRN